MCSIWALVASAFMTTITVDRPPFGEICVANRVRNLAGFRDPGRTPGRLNRARGTAQKKPRDLASSPGASSVLFEKSSRSYADAPSSARRPVVDLVKSQDHHQPRSAEKPKPDLQQGIEPTQITPETRPNQQAYGSEETTESDDRTGSDPVDPNRKVMVKKRGCPTGNPSAAVRQAAPGSHYTRDHLLSL